MGIENNTHCNAIAIFFFKSSVQHCRKKHSMTLCLFSIESEVRNSSDSAEAHIQMCREIRVLLK